MDAGKLSSGALPEDPEGLSASSELQVQRNLASLAGVAGNAQQCVQDMQQAFQSISDQAKASAALGSALALASQVCFASGGNPYVCGGMIMLALLMEMFGGKGGGGAGNGPGQEGGEGTGGGREVQVSAVGQTPGAGSSPSPQSPTGFDGASPGTWGSSVTGDASCSAAQGKLTCWTPKNVKADAASAKIVFDPQKNDDPSRNPHLAQVLGDVISHGPAADLVICASKDLKRLDGLLLVVPSESKSYPIKMHLAQGDTSPTLYYPGRNQWRAMSNESNEAQCAKAFR